MKIRNYTGIVPDHRPGKVPMTKTRLLNEDDESLESAYVKKHLKPKNQRMGVVQMKLWGNPYDPNY